MENTNKHTTARPLPRAVKNDARMELPIMLPTFDAIGMLERRAKKRARRQAVRTFCYEVITGIWHALLIVFLFGIMFHFGAIVFDWLQV